jgi:hypothetical protein
MTENKIIIVFYGCLQKWGSTLASGCGRAEQHRAGSSGMRQRRSSQLLIGLRVSQFSG